MERSQPIREAEGMRARYDRCGGSRREVAPGGGEGLGKFDGGFKSHISIACPGWDAGCASSV